MTEIERYIQGLLSAAFAKKFDGEFRQHWIEGEGTGEPMGLEEALTLLDEPE